LFHKSNKIWAYFTLTLMGTHGVYAPCPLGRHSQIIKCCFVSSCSNNRRRKQHWNGAAQWAAGSCCRIW